MSSDRGKAGNASAQQAWNPAKVAAGFIGIQVGRAGVPSALGRAELSVANAGNMSASMPAVFHKAMLEPATAFGLVG